MSDVGNVVHGVEVAAPPRVEQVGAGTPHDVERIGVAQRERWSQPGAPDRFEPLLGIDGAGTASGRGGKFVGDQTVIGRGETLEQIPRQRFRCGVMGVGASSLGRHHYRSGQPGQDQIEQRAGLGCVQFGLSHKPTDHVAPNGDRIVLIEHHIGCGNGGLAGSHRPHGVADIDDPNHPLTLEENVVVVQVVVNELQGQSAKIDRADAVGNGEHHPAADRILNGRNVAPDGLGGEAQVPFDLAFGRGMVAGGEQGRDPAGGAPDGLRRPRWPPDGTKRHSLDPGEHASDTAVGQNDGFLTP